MRYNLANTAELQDAFDYLTKLSGREAVVEVKRINPNRSLNQNSYLHLLLAYLGMEIGEDLESVKQMFKMVNKSIFYRKHVIFGTEFASPRSTADLSKEEMTQAIDSFHKFAAENGYPLPTAIDQAWLTQIQNEAERTHYR